MKWVEANQLNLNLGKTQVMILRRKNVETTNLPRIILGNIFISYLHKIKNLGLAMTSNLDWLPQINMISRNVHNVLWRLWRFVYLIPFKTHIKLVKSLIVPYLCTVTEYLGLWVMIVAQRWSLMIWSPQFLVFHLLSNCIIIGLLLSVYL